MRSVYYSFVIMSPIALVKFRQSYVTVSNYEKKFSAIVFMASSN